MKDEVSENYTLTKLARTSSFSLHPSSFLHVPLASPYWNGETYRAIFRSLLHRAIIDGSDIAELRSLLIERLGVTAAGLCGSGSLALELALRACGVQRGDEVVIPTFCCSAIVPPILAAGATPVLADVGAELNLTAETVEAVWTRNTRAIVVPHLFGNPADIEAIIDFARRRNVRVIDDAAQALGAAINGRPLGGFGDAGVVSFGDEKICFGLGGGVLITNQPGSIVDLAPGLSQARSSAILRRLAGTLFYRRWRRWTLSLGRVLKLQEQVDPDTPPPLYPMTGMANLQAAVAVSLIRTLDENVAARRVRARAYRELLGNEPGLELIPHRPGSACLAQVIRLLAKRPGHDAAVRLIAALGSRGFEVQGSYVPIHLLDPCEKCVWDALPYADRVWTDLVELPCEPTVGLEDVERISSEVRKFCRAQTTTRFSQSTDSGSTASGTL